MIKIKESQLIAMLNLVKENPDIDIWELMSVSGVRVLEEKSIDLDNPSFSDLLEARNADSNYSRTHSKSVPPKGQRTPPGQRNIPDKGDRYHPGQKEFYE